MYKIYTHQHARLALRNPSGDRTHMLAGLCCLGSLENPPRCLGYTFLYLFVAPWLKVDIQSTNKRCGIWKEIL